MPSQMVKVKASPVPAVAPRLSVDALAGLVIKGDLRGLNAEQRTTYYIAISEACGLNPALRPFEYLELNGKLVLYAKKDATEQLRKNQKVSLSVASRLTVGDVYMVEVKAETPDGRVDFATGAVSLGEVWQKANKEEGLQAGYRKRTGEEMANAYMRAETKAKRRATLSICGLGILDESELDTVAAVKIPVTPDTKKKLLAVTDKATAAAGKDLLAENLKGFGAKTVDDLTEEQAGSIVALLED